MKKAKLVSIVVLAGLALVVALQNTETVDTRLLFVTVSMPRAMLLVVVLLAGFVIGALVGARLARRRDGPRQT